MENREPKFGEFIAEKRKNQGITLRHMAEKLEISPAYLSDIEKSRRNPPDKTLLDRIATILKLTEDQKTLMYDLAARDRNEVSADLPDYIMNNEVVRVALRKAKNVATTEDWEWFIKNLNKKGSKEER